MYKMHVSNPLAETALGIFIQHFCRKVAICVFHCAAKYQGELVYKNLIGCPHYAVDVLWCQPIKLIQVVFTSEFHEY